MREGEGRGNKSSIYRKTDDKPNPSSPPLLMRGGSFPQESIFPALAAKLDKFAFTRVYLQLFRERLSNKSVRDNAERYYG